jgi:hypothetical protein
LLKRLTSGPRRESLIGDLVEQYQHRCSVTWYWRQVLIAILAGAAHDIRDHKLLTIPGVVIGWVFQWLFLRFILFQVSHLDDWLFETGFADVRSWWPDHRLLMSTFVCVGGLWTGWMVVRWCRASTALLFAASVSIFYSVWGCFVVVPSIRGAYVPHYLWIIIHFAVLIVLEPISIVLGGLLASNTAERGHPSLGV